MTNLERNRKPKLRLSRRALTLIELVVVIAILVALSGLIIPMVQGLGTQTNSATNATVVDDVNRAIGIYNTRFDSQPGGWDSLLTASGTLFNKVHPSMRLASTAVVQPMTLTAQQLESLQRAGIYDVRDSVDGSTLPPNLNDETIRTLATGDNVLQLTTTGSGISRRTVLDGGFRVNQYQDGDYDNEFVVLGLGRWSTLQGSAAMQIPLIQSADPTNNYARVCCVFMVPSNSSTTVFPARYVGCFLPDGTTARDNISRYNNSDN